MRKRRIIGGAVIIVVILALVGLYHEFSGYFVSDVIASKRISDNDRLKRWETDLDFLERELPQRHKNLFFKLPEEEFYARLSTIKENLATMDDGQICYELMKLVSEVGDSHTEVELNRPDRFPLEFFIFGSDVYLTDSAGEYSDYVGMRLVSIDGVPIREIEDKLLPIVPRDNEMITKNQSSILLRQPQYLEMLDILPDLPEKTGLPNADFTFEDDGGQLHPVNIVAREGEYQTFSSTAEGEKRLPFFTRQKDVNYWYTYLAQEKTMYVKYNSCSSDPDYPMEEFTEDVLREYDQKQGQRLIVDLRDNGGGNSEVFRPFFDALEKRPDINQKNKLFVITGRRTFSSAVLNAMEFRNQTNAILVGEPTGGKPNHFGEVKYLHLSNVDLPVSYSIKYFERSKEEVDAIYPDLEVEMDPQDYFRGEDSFLKAILN